MASLVSVPLMIPAKLSGETCQGVVGRYPELPLDIQHFHWKPPFRHSPEHRRTPASCELAAEQVTNAASASRTSSADTFLAG